MNKAVVGPISTRLYGPVALLRPRQWIKNGFVLAPLIFAGLFLNPAAIRNSIWATLLFCLASSATYIINDIRDIESDRLHPVKSKTRPLASGATNMSSALLLLVLIVTALGWGWYIQPEVMTVIFIYLGLNGAYSFALKHQPVLDIFTIAIGFVLRVFAGATALQVPVSSWMFITTLCLALYLAAVKRRQELALQGTTGRKVLEKYSVALVDRYAEMSATGALIFYSMFVMSERPQLAITVPMVLFGLFRYWYIVEVHEHGESPTDVLLSDGYLLATGGRLDRDLHLGFVAQMTSPSYLITPFLAWLCTGCLKFCVNSAKARRLAFHHIGYGGFPSNHSAIVSSMTVLVALREGIAHPAFGVALTLAFIVILDAASLRRQVGRHAVAINRLASASEDHAPLRERIGHSRIEIAGGLVSGSVVAWAVHAVIA